VNSVPLIRAAALYVPLALTAGVWLAWAPSPRARAAAILATAWNVPALLALHVAARRFGWWSFGVSDATIAGFPIDLYLGWAVAWGALPSLLGRRMPVAALVVLAVALDVIAMPRLAPVVELGETWLTGEVAATLTCLVPAQLLAVWTRSDSQVLRRAAFQAVAFAGLVLGALPAVILQQSGGSWSALTARPGWLTGMLIQLLIVPALLGLSAVQEFAVRGKGTPVPFDPPKRLVATGPYAYVRNPMQLSAALVMLGWGAILESWWVAAGAIMAVVYGSGFAAGDEQGDLDRRFGDSWRAYAGAVRSWIPRWRPIDARALMEGGALGAVPGAESACGATLYVAEECGPCSQVRAWFEAHHPVGLTIVAAESHPSRSLTRITYDPGDGTGDSSGVAAVGRALEHINFAWALVGMFVRLPGVGWILQIVTDASGGAPKELGADSNLGTGERGHRDWGLGTRPGCSYSRGGSRSGRRFPAESPVPSPQSPTSLRGQTPSASFERARSNDALGV
jgi:protein-S-isoprenylcysteine O-methyltransferase Ste14